MYIIVPNLVEISTFFYKFLPIKLFYARKIANTSCLCAIYQPNTFTLYYYFSEYGRIPMEDYFSDDIVIVSNIIRRNRQEESFIST